MRQYFRQYFIFSENERRAAIGLVALALVLLVLPYIAKYFHQEERVFDSSLQAKVNLFTEEYSQPKSFEKTSSFDSLFLFDPNKIGVAEWLKLGLSEKQATVIEKYKAKGGKFYKAEDIRKIFVLSDEKKEQLLPYVQIGNTANNAQTIVTQEPKKQGRLKVDINTADSVQFEKLRGIGAKLSSRIVKYREWLGGFYSIDQLSEVYALPDSTFQKIKPDLTISQIPLRKLNINTADYETFRSHPYTRKVAGYIVKYRNSNGGFKTTDQICRVPEMTDSICKKLMPYVVIE